MSKPTLLAAGWLLAAGALCAQTATTTTLNSITPASPKFGDVVALSAQVTPSGVSGPVAFMDGAALVGVATLNGAGLAQLTTQTLSAGSHSLRAVYGGGGGFNSSQSA